jgi:hypothetical protein
MLVLPLISTRRDRPIRRLSPAECDLLEYAPPLVVARREYRFLVGPWRPSTTYVVIKHPDQVVMTCTKRQLNERGITVA